MDVLQYLKFVSSLHWPIWCWTDENRHPDVPPTTLATYIVYRLVWHGSPNLYFPNTFHSLIINNCEALNHKWHVGEERNGDMEQVVRGEYTLCKVGFMILRRGCRMLATRSSLKQGCNECNLSCTTLIKRHLPVILERFSKAFHKLQGRIDIFPCVCLKNAV